MRGKRPRTENPTWRTECLLSGVKSLGYISNFLLDGFIASCSNDPSSSICQFMFVRVLPMSGMEEMEPPGPMEESAAAGRQLVLDLRRDPQASFRPGRRNQLGLLTWLPRGVAVGCRRRWRRPTQPGETCVTAGEWARPVVSGPCRRRRRVLVMARTTRVETKPSIHSRFYILSHLCFSTLFFFTIHSRFYILPPVSGIKCYSTVFS
jgi:hypothetical protein